MKGNRTMNNINAVKITEKGTVFQYFKGYNIRNFTLKKCLNTAIQNQGDIVKFARHTVIFGKNL